MRLALRRAKKKPSAKASSSKPSAGAGRGRQLGRGRGCGRGRAKKPTEVLEIESEEEPLKVKKRPSAKHTQHGKKAQDGNGDGKASKRKAVAQQAGDGKKVKGKQGESDSKNVKRATFAGRRCPDNDPAKARFLAMRDTYFEMITPNIAFPSYREAGVCRSF